MIEIADTSLTVVVLGPGVVRAHMRSGQDINCPVYYALDR